MALDIGKLTKVISCLLIICSANLPERSAAKGIDFDEVYGCPVNGVVRVASRETALGFQSLQGCSNLLASRSAIALPESAAVVRIIGVSGNGDSEKTVKKKKKSGSSAGPVIGRRSGRPFDGEIHQVAARYRIDPVFLHAMVATESSYRPRVVSRAGALGLMQIMPGTGTVLGVDRVGLLDPARNLDAGARHLKYLQSRYGRDFSLILGAYNAGEGAVARYGNRVPPYPETMQYVANVMGRYGKWRAAGIGAAQ